MGRGGLEPGASSVNGPGSLTVLTRASSGWNCGQPRTACHFATLTRSLNRSVPAPQLGDVTGLMAWQLIPVYGATTVRFRF